MNRINNKKKRKEIICRCNNVNRDLIENSILEGAQNLNEIFDATSAGVGACGGSCRRIIDPILKHYLKFRVLPEKKM